LGKLVTKKTLQRPVYGGGAIAPTAPPPMDPPLCVVACKLLLLMRFINTLTYLLTYLLTYSRPRPTLEEKKFPISQVVVYRLLHNILLIIDAMYISIYI